MAQVPVKELSTYKTETIEGFVGTMYAFTEYNERIKNDPDTFTYYIPSTDYTATYYTTDFKVDEQFTCCIAFCIILAFCRGAFRYTAFAFAVRGGACILR